MAITTTENDIKERLSLAYVTAVAARAGCEVREFHVQRNALDVTISAIAGTLAKIDVQLKSTSNDCIEDDYVFFDLDVATYDKLRTTQIQSAQLLVVFVLPANNAEWLAMNEEALILKKSAYWQCFQGAQAVSNAVKLRVRLPRAQIFGPEALRDLMARAHAKAQLGQTGI
jgi:hypothetical protein